MPSFRTGRVSRILSDRQGLQRVEVDGRPAYVLTQLVGPVAVGDDVVVNVTATELALGTGGWDVVHWNLRREQWSAPGPGHIMKLRYTSLQFDAGSAEEQPGYEEPAGLDGMPVVACFLHSQVPCVGAAFREAAPARRLAYVMTDGAALPAALSDLLHRCRETGLIDLTVTAGQAFGGDLEAVNVASALLVARSAGADAVVVGSGPGGVGTATPHGFSALEVAQIVDTTSRQGGHPIVALRWSDADARDRHRGLSHHSSTALHETGSAADVAVPLGEAPPALAHHRPVEVDVGDPAALLARWGLDVTTMGRDPSQDPGFFAYAAAAGVLAARMVPTDRR